MKITQLLRSSFGPIESYISACSEAEKQFWNTAPPKSTTTLWQAAKAYPKGRIYVTKTLLIRCATPLAILILIPIILCSFVILIFTIVLPNNDQQTLTNRAAIEEFRKSISVSGKSTKLKFAVEAKDEK